MNTVKEVERALLGVVANFEYFKSQLPELKTKHLKKLALLHTQKIIHFFESENYSIKIGTKDYGEGRFSVQQVADTRIELGCQSYVII